MLKKISLRGSQIIYLGIILFSLAVSIKPGASIFHYRLRLDPGQIKPDEGYGYRYPLKLNSLIFPAEGGILRENSQPLRIDAPSRLIEDGDGLYYLTDPRREAHYVYFAPSGNSDPRTNGNTYTLFLPLIFFSRSTGLAILALFSVLLVNSITNSQTLEQHRTATWKSLFLWILLSAYTYVCLEWLFFITKPSFMDTVSVMERAGLLLQTGFFLAFPALVIGLVLYALDHLPAPVGHGNPLILADILPAISLACISLLMLDNFTYTVFRFGIVTSQGIWRLAYGGGFLVIFILFHRRLMGALGLRGERSKPAELPGPAVVVLLGLFAVSLVSLALQLDFSSFTNSPTTANTVADNRPNIILLGGDGLQAANLSAYDYERDTTPALRQLAAEALVAENAFPNAAHSSGSVISILTSKLPTQTRVLYPPDILQEKDAYQHLPGILKQLGYYTVEIGVPHYVDAFTVNLQRGFDLVNNRTLEESSWIHFLQGAGIDNTIYFNSLLTERITARLNHIFYIQKMVNPIDKVTNPSDYIEDEERVEQLIEIINSSDRPFFVHVHMMGTHGGNFYPQTQKYSLGQTQDEEWMIDFYDDAVLSFDSHLRTVLDVLEQSGKLDNTILVIYSDHAMIYKVNERIPLIIRFPYGEYAGRIQANVQNLDISPTLLYYLGIPVPEWMGGLSLLQNNIPPDRLIYSSGTLLMSDGSLLADKLKAPFYQFSYFYTIQCDHWYYYETDTGKWWGMGINGHTAPCNPEDRLPEDQVRQELADQLIRNGFDITTLP